MTPVPPRGIRNHNPGNIRKSRERWQGLAPTQTDPAFFQFISAVFGIRALAKVLKTYQKKHGLRTVRQIIGRWAPANGDSNGPLPGGEYKQDTGAYVTQVAKAVKVSADEAINLADPQTMVALVTAIIRHENGVQPYHTTLIRQGVDMA